VVTTYTSAWMALPIGPASFAVTVSKLNAYLRTRRRKGRLTVIRERDATGSDTLTALSLSV